MKKKKHLNIHLLQFSIAWEDQEKNYQKVLSLLRKRPPSRGSIICLPELFSTGYTMNAKKFAEKIYRSPTAELLSGIAQFYESYVIGSLIIKTKAKPTNSAVVFSPKGDLICQYDKIHLFPLGKEYQTYRPGQEIPCFKIKEKTFSVLICYDLRFPEIFRIAYEKNVSGIFILANWPSARHQHWKTLIQARAIENQCYIFSINRTGRDPHYRYNGGSCIVHPSGKVLASSSKEGIISCKIDFADTDKERKKFPFKKSRACKIYKKYPPYK